ncbi:MAG: redox-regulated ATPase YchF [Gammaproteobacteria bacterium]|jgi:GTP-binding protein YchF|nr:redox-regulated ATPase YchF [SAR86 cluster bacterium]RZO95655.1 MAG: redox-regulated ATPase YchF [Gammaproteobacteria bacterium]|tara:strand:- start:76 stop:1164 length:1089 start_codon:yes stop_codon:yes gene_type:complete
MSLKCGIVGLPNVGKSTLFNALTAAGIEAQNFPFCTIEPNKGIVAVPDPRLNEISGIVNPEKMIATTTEFVDIAGLVKGASEGEGLGNKFLSHIRETQAIIHVIRCFENPDITHVHDEVDPVVDLETVETELLLSDIETLTNALMRLEKASRSGDKEIAVQKEKFESLSAELSSGVLGRNAEAYIKDSEAFKELGLITVKPCLYVGNVEDLDAGNDLLDQLTNYANERNSVVLPMCNQLEAEIAELDYEEGLEFLQDMGLDEPGLNKLIRESYKMLSLITYFTAGEKEVRAWTVKDGSTAPEAAGVIHTDFQKGFIRAETTAYSDFITHQGESGAKEAGKLRSEGSDYIVKDGDIMHFRFNV